MGALFEPQVYLVLRLAPITIFCRVYTVLDPVHSEIRICVHPKITFLVKLIPSEAQLRPRVPVVHVRLHYRVNLLLCAVFNIDVPNNPFVRTKLDACESDIWVVQ